MPRYYSKKTGSEVLPSVHTICDQCVELPDDHWFWQPLPDGKVAGQDENGMPIIISVADEHKAANERAWRDGEIRRVSGLLDQIRNDEAFGSSTYRGAHSGEALNAYRVALCNYPAQDDFPHGRRPSL